MQQARERVVLVVDDESPVREIQRRVLERGGYRVIEAPGAAEAFRLLDNGLPDLLIADLDMPELSGEEMVRRIHATHRDLKVLYVTANIDRLLDVRSIVWEGEAFLDKPFTSKGLLEAVSMLLTGTLNGGTAAPLPEPMPPKRGWLPWARR